MLTQPGQDPLLRAKTLRGVRWSAISQFVSQGFTFVISLVLARILGPEAFGVIGMIYVFTGFAAIFADLGLGAALIQRKDLEPRHLNAAFLLNVATGAFMTLSMIAISPAISWFYEEPALMPLTSAIAFKYLIDSFSAVPLARLNREMRFGSLAWVQIGSGVFGGLVGLLLAMRGMGPMSLVAQALVTSIVSTAIAWHVAKWRPNWSFDYGGYKDLFRFSIYYLGSNLVNYWSRSLDQLLIGKFAGATALGLYARAYSLMLLPLSQVSRVVGRVMFPALSTIQNDKQRVKRIYLKAIRSIALITFPGMIGAFAVSDHLIPVLLGDKWNAIIPLFNIFCWVGLLQSISTTVGWIFVSQGRSDVGFKLTSCFAVLYAIGFLIGIQWGAIGVAWAYLIGNFILWFPSASVSGRLIDLRIAEMLKSLAPILLCALGMGFAVWKTGWLLPPGLAHWQFLAAQVPLGICAYLALVFGFNLKSSQESRRALAEIAFGMLRSGKAAVKGHS